MTVRILHRALPLIGVLLVLFGAVAPVAAADPAPTAKVEPALLEAARKGPNTKFSVIVMAEKSRRG